MAWNQERYRVLSARSADGADGPGPAYGPRNVAVAFGLAGGDFPQFPPHALLKFRSNRKIKGRQLSGFLSRENFSHGQFSGPVPAPDLDPHIFLLAVGPRGGWPSGGKI